MDWVVGFNVHVDYTFKFANESQATFILDMFNLANIQTTTKVDMGYENAFDSVNPAYLNKIEYQTPRQIRFGIRYSF